MQTHDFWIVSEAQAAWELTPADSEPTLVLVAAHTNLLNAWDRVRKNQGAPGVDGVSISDLEPQFPGLAHELGKSLLAGVYHPQPVRRIEVPKPSGGWRKLGIPTVIDRTVQQAILQVLRPVFEPHFSPYSFAYRPGRGPLDAVRHLQQRISPDSSWILHGDVEDFFDSVPHRQILAAMAAKVKDPALFGLVQ